MPVRLVNCRVRCGGWGIVVLCLNIAKWFCLTRSVTHCELKISVDLLKNSAARLCFYAHLTFKLYCNMSHLSQLVKGDHGNGVVIPTQCSWDILLNIGDLMGFFKIIIYE